MDTFFLQNLRYKLQKRVRRLNSTDFNFFHPVLKQFWGFITSNKILTGILDDLQQRQSQAVSTAQAIIRGRQLIGDTEEENAAISYSVLKQCAELDVDSHYIEGEIGDHYRPSSDGFKGGIEVFKELFLEPFYEYLDEQLDDQRAILALLRRYKHKCEWFQRDKMHEMWKLETQRGEKKLALDLYEYLYDQGLDFNIEPWSISGEADLVAAQKSNDPLIADVKVFSDSNKKSYIVSGFHQVYQYTGTYNEPFGYLIIFNTSGTNLQMSLPNQEQSTPFVVLNGKTIFMLTIDIYPITETASKGGKLKTVEITEKDLITVLNEAEAQG